jgi:sterol 3beta-glucosyltransferase
MAGRDPARLTAIVVEALRRANVRGILATGWGGLSPADLPDSIFKLDHAPHDWLFPRVAAVVHHGGAGTTAAGLRAGRPTLVCPFIADQPFWGRRVHALGVGARPIPQKRLTPDNLAAAIHEISTNQTIRDNAAALGERIRSEDGLRTAVAMIEDHLRWHGRARS